MSLAALARSMILPCLAIVAGMLLPVQAGSNASLGRAVGGTVAVFVSLAVSAALLLVAVLAWRPQLPPGPGLGALPAWSWLGGPLGAAYLLSITFAAPRLGAGATIALVVLGQMVCSVALDHVGAIGFAQRPADPVRLAGVALVVGGAFLVARA